jgi:hypothetical protein
MEQSTRTSSKRVSRCTVVACWRYPCDGRVLDVTAVRHSECRVLMGSVSAVNVCGRMWKDTDGDIAYLRQGNFALSFDNEDRKSLTTHKYEPAVGVDDLFLICAEFGGLPPRCGGTGGV